MSRSWRLGTLAGAALLLLSGCSSSETSRVFSVGILSGTDDFLPITDGFKAEMAELGYGEGTNIVYRLHRVNADSEALKRNAEQLVKERVDLILAAPTEASVAAQAAARDSNIPVVFAYAGLEGSQLARGVREPGGNVTGVRFPGPEQIAKRLEILLQMAPKVRRIWIGYDRHYPNTRPVLEVLRPMAAARHVALVECPVTNLAQFEAELAARRKAADPGVDAILLMPETLNHSPRGWVAIRDLAAARNLPIAGSFLYTVEQGAIFGNANDLFAVGQLAASLADRILRGAAAGTLPVITPEQELWINYQRARELGLDVPLDLLKQARKIIRQPSGPAPALP